MSKKHEKMQQDVRMYVGFISLGLAMRGAMNDPKETVELAMALAEESWHKKVYEEEEK